MSKVLCVAGARPNFMKLAPLYHALAGRTERVLLHTGQHFDDAMSDRFLRDLGLPLTSENLAIGPGDHAEQTAAVLVGSARVIKREQPDLVVVVGDVNSTLGAALAAAKLQVPIAHVEAGLRSFDRTMPEEVNRVLVDALADLCFVTSPEACDHLKAEGIGPERIHFVGNPMIDSLLAFLPKARGLAGAGTRPRGSYGVVTLHRASNVDRPGQLDDLIGTLSAVGERIPLVFPVHPRTRLALSGRAVPLSDRVTLVPPAGYLEFLALMDGSRIVLTDSGGVQEETTVLGIPCLTLRHNTERPITITQGTNRLVGTSREEILAAVDEVLAADAAPSAVPPLWDGEAGARIAAEIAKYLALRS